MIFFNIVIYGAAMSYLYFGSKLRQTRGSPQSIKIVYAKTPPGIRWKRGAMGAIHAKNDTLYKTADGKVFDSFEDAADAQGRLDELDFSSDEESDGVPIPGEVKRRIAYRVRRYGRLYKR